MTAKTKETKSEMKDKKLTKRQKHKLGPNQSNAWPQQPKIKSMAARDKAYIRMAGLGPKQSSSSSSTKKAPLNPNDDIINSPEYKFGRLLASPNARTRHSTILKLQEYLKARTEPSNENGGLSVLDLMKLWKGLWHTLYLCDGVAVQEEVSKVLSGLIWSVGGTQEEDEYAGRFYLDLDENGIDNDDCDDDDMEEGDTDEDEGGLMQIVEMSDEEDSEDDGINENDSEMEGNNGADAMDSHELEVDDDYDDDDDIENPAIDEETKHCRGAHLSALFVRTYFRTLNREWCKMDKYRIDKFYTLTRYVLRDIYRYMASRHWNLGIIRLFNDAIFEEVLREHKYGNGVRFHLLDICLDELALVNSEKETGLSLTEATYLDCMEPYFAMAQRVEDNIVHERVMEKVMSKFLDEFSIVSDNYSSDEPDSDKKKKLIMDQVHVQTVAQFIFELASDTETDDRYRKQLYDMHKIYMKRVKTVGRDVIMHECDDDDCKLCDDDVDDYKLDHDHTEQHQMNADIDQDVDDDKNLQQIESNNSCPSEEKKATKKKKKKKMKENHEIKGGSQGISNVSDEDTNQSKKKKKKKKKKSSNDPSHSNNDIKGADNQSDGEAGEITITISSVEQKAAAHAASLEEEKKVLQKKSSATPKEKPILHKKTKRVKFDKVNKSKSYKASMNDLKKLDHKATLGRIPEKSILMKRKQRK